MKEWDLDEVSENLEESDEAKEELDNLPEVEENVEETIERSGLLENLENPNLFDEYEEGDYCYLEEENGKSAWGSLKLSDEGIRNPYAQRKVGGEFREDTDDGGHLIGTRFAGSGELENLDAQNRDVNRGAYKSEENRWAANLKEGNKVFVNVDTYKREGIDRPDVYMGYVITENSNGKRSWDAFSYQNVSREEQAEWAESDEGEWEMDD